MLGPNLPDFKLRTALHFSQFHARLRVAFGHGQPPPPPASSRRSTLQLKALQDGICALCLLDKGEECLDSVERALRVLPGDEETVGLDVAGPGAGVAAGPRSREDSKSTTCFWHT